MGEPEDPAVSRTFTPSSAADLADPALMPRRFELLAGEVRALADSINRKVVPALERIVERLDEDSADIGKLQRDVGTLRDRVENTEIELLALAGGVSR